MRSNSTGSIRLAALILLVSAIGCGREETVEKDNSSPSVQQPMEQPPAQVTPSLSSIRAAVEQGRNADAVSKARAYLVANPGHAEALFLAAQSLMALSQEQEAIETLKSVPPDDPEFGLNSLGQIADWQMSQGMVDEAEANFRKLIELHGDIPLAHSRLATLMNAQGKRYESVPHLRKLVDLQDITRRELGALVTISEQCGVEIVPGTTGTESDLVEGDLRRARQMAMVQQWDQSLKLTEQLRQEFPDSTSIAAFLGTLYATLQRPDALSRWHEDLPPGTDQQPEYWTAIANWMVMRGQHEEAIRCALESVSRDPTNHRMYQTLAQSLRAIGQLEEAEVAQSRSETLRRVHDVFQQTFVRQPTATDYAQIGQGLLELNRPWESVAWLQTAAAINPRDEKVIALNQQLREHEPAESELSWVLCGLNIDSFPLPTDMQPPTVVTTSGAESNRRIKMANVADELGLQFQYDVGNDRQDGSYLLHQTMGGGIGVIDFDRDGWPDVYLSQAGGEAFSEQNLPNRLFRNLSGTQFVDVTDPSATGDRHYGQGVTAADLNQDGFVDLIVANIGPNVLFQNNGDGTFTRKPLAAWDDRDHWTSLVAAGDLSGDGLPELVECNYIDDPQATKLRCTPTEQLCAPAEFQSSTDRVLQGQADGRFRKWPQASELERQASYSLGVIIANIDGEHGNELFIANDTRSNAYWVSRPQTGGEDRYRLSEEARIRGVATGPVGELQGCMGIAVGDFDHNRTFDMYVTNYYNEASNLYLQQSSGLFIDQAAGFGARKSSVLMVGFGTQAADLDRDGWLDLGVLNGHAVDRRDKGEPLQMRPQLFRGRRGQMETLAPEDAFWKTPTLGRSLALIDFDRDGGPDMIAGHLDHPVALLHNRSQRGNWIQFELVGVESERDAVGAIISIEVDGEVQVGWVTAGDGYFCTNEPVIDFGIDTATQIENATIQWPSGQVQQLGKLEAGERHLVVEGQR